ncbi:hypothetical protein O7C57_00675 [Providencia sp. 21OH12SH02B-Prov]|uniref:hypothetical protein n=1 Tax=Providencia sp. 21OH12SH02B-Prov TaxID=3015951 RepID=UPI0022B69775|nr:hypothetical protein O7C57_00675 [Providencia sp. 21OH12SH02B-Prov]
MEKISVISNEDEIKNFSDCLNWEILKKISKKNIIPIREDLAEMTDDTNNKIKIIESFNVNLILLLFL